MGITEPKAEIRTINPAKLLVTEEYNVRLYGDPNEDKLIEELADSIERDGQIDPISVIPVPKKNSLDDSEEQYIVYSGTRRRRALLLINERRTRNAQPILRARIEIDRREGDIFRRAIVPNIHRHFTAMETAALVSHVIDKYKWMEKGPNKAAVLAAEYFGISRPQVIQLMKVVNAPQELKDDLHSGKISMESALLLLKATKDIEPAKRGEIIKEKVEVAKEIQDKERASKPAKAAKPADNSKPSKAKPERIEAPAIAKAIRTTAADESDAPVPKNRKEIIEFFAEKDGPAYGAVDSAVREFCVYFVEKWCKGLGNDKTADKKFDAMTEGASKGTGKMERESAKPKEAPKAKEAKPKAAPKPNKKVVAKKATKKAKAA